MALILFETLFLSDQDHINGPSNSSFINDQDLLRDFSAFTLCFPLKCFVPRVSDLVPNVHFQINCTDLLQLFRLLLVHKIPKLWILCHLSSLMMDGPKILRDFGTFTSPLLLCTQGLILVCLPPNPMVVGPSHSNLMDGIHSSPLRFLCSTGRRSNDPGSFFTTDLTDFVAPPPNLLTSSSLEDFFSVQRLWPLTFLLRVHLLDLILSLIIIISSDL
jgi:hypothetical protein